MNAYMFVYLIHLESPMHHAQHYTGCAADMIGRLAKHRKGTGARMLQVATERGIPFDIVRAWSGGYTKERAIKDLKCAPKLCPVCAGESAWNRQPSDLDHFFRSDDMPPMPAGSGFDQYMAAILAGQRRARRVSPMANHPDILDLALDQLADMRYAL